MRRAAVITSSDSGSRGEREDISGQVIARSWKGKDTR